MGVLSLPQNLQFLLSAYVHEAYEVDLMRTYGVFAQVRIGAHDGAIASEIVHFKDTGVDPDFWKDSKNSLRVPLTIDLKENRKPIQDLLNAYKTGKALKVTILIDKAKQNTAKIQIDAFP